MTKERELAKVVLSDSILGIVQVYLEVAGVVVN